MAYHVIDEAKRCLQCKKPGCTRGCPVSTQVPTVIKMLLEGQIKDAGELLFSNNPLSLVCSFVCEHEKQCEGNCVLNKTGKTIHVSSIENYISGYYLNLKQKELPKPTKAKVAIIGSGPAGITIAIILAAKGYDITIFEANDKIGGIMMYGIPEFRLPKTVLDRYKEILLGMGIKIRPNTVIGSGGGLSIDDLFRDGYKAIFVGTGVWKPNTLRIKGESLGNAHFAINYLKNPDAYNLGDKISIIGAGNVAMDVARTALRKGAREVTVFFRRTEEYLTASKYELEYAKMDGVKFEFLKSPVEITDKGVIFADTTWNGEEIEIVPDSDKLYESDSVIISVSQGPRNYIAASTQGLDLSNKGLIVTNDYGGTSKPGVFASGDVVTGAKTVVEAVNVSKKVAAAIEEYLESLS